MELRCVRQLLISLVLISNFTFANEINLVRYIESKKYPDLKQSYFVDLLTLALEASKVRYGDYKLQPVNIEMAQARTSVMLQREEYIDLTWRMTSQALETKLQAIYFPTLKGLMGYRIFIIPADEQSRFPKNILLSELKAMPVGQGANWADTDILKSNDFAVVEGSYSNLLKMLTKNRFSYFPRALHEPWQEIEGNDSLVVEKNLALKYNSPIFFFVNKTNTRLNNRINLGLTKLIQSGEFDIFFTQHAMTSGILDKAQLSSRTVFELSNPYISATTQALVDNKKLWLKFQ